MWGDIKHFNISYRSSQPLTDNRIIRSGTFCQQKPAVSWHTQQQVNTVSLFEQRPWIRAAAVSHYIAPDEQRGVKCSTRTFLYLMAFSASLPHNRNISLLTTDSETLKANVMQSVTHWSSCMVVGVGVGVGGWLWLRHIKNKWSETCRDTKGKVNTGKSQQRLCGCLHRTLQMAQIQRLRRLL